MQKIFEILPDNQYNKLTSRLVYIETITTDATLNKTSITQTKIRTFVNGKPQGKIENKQMEQTWLV